MNSFAQRKIEMMLNNLEIVTKFLAVLIALIALVVNAYYSRLRFQHDQASRSISASEGLLNQWTSEEMRIAKTFILEELRQKFAPELGFSKLPVDAQNMVVPVSHLCDRIAMRMIFGEANEALLITMLGERLVHLWDTLQPYIEHERKHREGNSPGEYQVFFEAMAQKIKKMNISKLRHDYVKKYLKTRIA
jgi:hypothetical protein